MTASRNSNGYGNNPNNPELGQVGSPLIRFSDPDYSDGVSGLAGAGRPSAREISNSIFTQEKQTGNDQNLSDLFWLWGQFLDHDITLTPPQKDGVKADIAVPKGDKFFDPMGSGTAKISFTRSTFDESSGSGKVSPREQVNEITPFIDGSSVYGSTAERLEALRGEGGKLKTSDGNLLPFNVDGLPNDGRGADETFFLAGDVRANENVGLTSLHTIFVREHNRMVDEIKKDHPDWTDDQLFNQARKLVEAELQMITYNEFLPKLIGEDAISEYSGYKSDVNPQIANEFSTAAFRIGHTMLSNQIERVNEDGSDSAAGHLMLREAFFQPGKLTEGGGIDSVIRGVASNEAEALDTTVIDDVRNFLFGPPGAGGLDLASLNIQRGRDHGLDDYNGVREAYGLKKVKDFSEITKDAELQGKLKELYGTVDNIDLFVGGLAEDPKGDSLMGELFTKIVADQFTRIRDGDAFWHENNLSKDELAVVSGVTLSEVIKRNTDIENLQDDVFTVYDRVAGSDDNDVLRAGNGNELLMGMAGDDALIGNKQAEQMEGGAGNDILEGVRGNDVLDGGAGDDILIGGRGNDVLRGGEGSDTLKGNRGRDTLDGGAGDDYLIGGRGRDTYVISEGKDIIFGFRGKQDSLDFSNFANIRSKEDLSITSFKGGTLIEISEGNAVWLSKARNIEKAEFKFAGDNAVASGSTTTAGTGTGTGTPTVDGSNGTTSDNNGSSNGDTGSASGSGMGTNSGTGTSGNGNDGSGTTNGTASAANTGNGADTDGAGSSAGTGGATGTSASGDAMCETDVSSNTQPTSSGASSSSGSVTEGGSGSSNASARSVSTEGGSSSSSGKGNDKDSKSEKESEGESKGASGSGNSNKGDGRSKSDDDDKGSKSAKDDGKAKAKKADKDTDDDGMCPVASNGRDDDAGSSGGRSDTTGGRGNTAEGSTGATQGQSGSGSTGGVSSSAPGTVIAGTDGNDTLRNESGTQYVLGGAGEDTFLVDGNSGDFRFGSTLEASDKGIVVWDRDGGHDILYDVEMIRFNDAAFDLEDGDIA